MTYSVSAFARALIPAPSLFSVFSASATEAKSTTYLGETIKGLNDTIRQKEQGRMHYLTEFQTKNTELHDMTELKKKLESQIAAGSPAAALTVVQDQVVALTQEKSDLDKQILDKDNQIDKLKTELDAYKAERERDNRTRIEELLKKLQELVHFPVHKSSV
jgi:hypothetical protein